jgi:hypothetical protein
MCDRRHSLSPASCLNLSVWHTCAILCASFLPLPQTPRTITNKFTIKSTVFDFLVFHR